MCGTGKTGRKSFADDLELRLANNKVPRVHVAQQDTVNVVIFVVKIFVVM